MPEMLFEKLGKVDYFQETSQVLFYHLAVINIAKRALMTDEKNCSCGINPKYIAKKSPFFCSEDKFVSADDAYNAILKISNTKTIFETQFKPVKLLQYLKENSGKLFSASKIDQIFRSETRNFWYNDLTPSERSKAIALNKGLGVKSTQKQTKYADEEVENLEPVDNIDCILMGVTNASDCGCCGNNHGRCGYCSLWCLLHDQACTTCTPSWFCFSGCVPGRC